MLEFQIKELEEAKSQALAAGLSDSQILLDPGIGFSKTAGQCWELLRDLTKLGRLEELMLGISRKRFLGEITGNALPADRSGETLAIELEFAQRNIGIIRTHAVKELHSAITALNYFRSLK